MTCVALLLDKARDARSIPSDNALALAIGQRRQVVSQWRKGDSYPSEDHIAQLAKMAREDEGVWLVRVRAERTTGPAHVGWERVLRQLGAAAVLGAVALLPFNAEASLTERGYMHYAKWRALARRLLGRLHGPSPVLA